MAIRLAPSVSLKWDYDSVTGFAAKSVENPSSCAKLDALPGF